MSKMFFISLFMLFSLNSFSQQKKMTKKKFDQIISGVWVVHYYEDTSHTTKEHLSYISNMVDTVYIKSNFEMTQIRTMIDSDDTYVYKEVCSYDEKEKKVKFYSEGYKVPSSYTLLSLNQDEIIMEFYGISEDASQEKKRVEVRYRRIR